MCLKMQIIYDMEEIWKEIKGYEGLYMVSNLGKITNVKTGKLKSVHLDKHTGYYKVHLCRNGKSKNCFLHRIIAENFIPNAFNKTEVDHINTIRTDNRISNLRWCTRKENRNNPLSLQHLQIAFTGKNSPHYGRKRSLETRQKISNSLRLSQKVRGRKGALSKLSRPVSQFSLSGDFIARYDGQADACRKTGIPQSSISCVINGKMKSAHGFLWKFSD